MVSRKNTRHTSTERKIRLLVMIAMRMGKGKLTNANA